MKTGRNVAEVLREVQARAASKRDYVVPTPALTMTPETMLEIRGAGQFSVTEHTHNQLGERLQIPAKYYDRMRTDAPALLADNVNTWFKKNPEKRMVRTLTMERPTARAFLSDRYRRLDDIDLAENVLPELVDRNLQICSCEITERKLYIKWVTPGVQGEVKRGDVVQAGGVITNSEIGLGAISVQPYVIRLACTNGAVMEDFGQRKYHTGRAAQSDEEAYSIFTDETIQADDRAFWLKIRDTVRAVLEQNLFDKILNRMRESMEQKIEGDIPAVVELLGNKYALDKGEREGVLKHLIEDGNGLTAWGVSNAVTSVAGESASYDRSDVLERLGGALTSLQPTEWKQLAAAKVS